MKHQTDEVVKLWERIPLGKRPVVLEILRALAAEDVERLENADNISDVDSSLEGVVIPPRIGVHALLKLGIANSTSGPVHPIETITCLDYISLMSSPNAYLGTTSQSVSEKYRGSGGITRLYILVGKEVKRVVDVSAVFNQEEFNKDHASIPDIVTCPKGMENARTWFKIEKVWNVIESPSPDEIIIAKTGKNVGSAISAGRATFFYVKPLKNLTVKI